MLRNQTLYDVIVKEFNVDVDIDEKSAEFIWSKSTKSSLTV